MFFLNCIGNVYYYLITCRKVADRPRDPAKWSEIADVVASVSIPVIANGDVFEYDDFRRIKVATGNYRNISNNSKEIIYHIVMYDEPLLDGC